MSRRIIYYFLEDDYEVLKRLLDENQAEIKQLGREQAEAAAQGTENMGHDDACQEAIAYERARVLAHSGQLHPVFRHARVESAKSIYHQVRFGAIVTLKRDGIQVEYQIGSYMVFTEHNPARISYASKLGQMLLGKESDDEFDFNGFHFEIIDVRAKPQNIEQTAAVQAAAL